MVDEDRQRMSVPTSSYTEDDGSEPLSRKRSTFHSLKEWETGDDQLHASLYEQYEVAKTPPVTVEGTMEKQQLRGVKNTRGAIKNAFARLGRASKFESIDYSEPGNDIQTAWNLERPHSDYRNAELWKWIIPVFVAFIMAFISWFVAQRIKDLTYLKFSTAEPYFAEQSFGMAYIMMLVFSMGYAALAGTLVSMVSPLAAGSGISEVKTFLNGVRIPGLLAFKTFLAKMIGITFTISSGIIAGKEGPFIHGGAIVGGGLGQMGSDCLSVISNGRITMKLPRWFGGYHRNHSDHRDFVAIGTAIGVAVAFSAPIGGILFTVEEGASFYTRSSFWRAFLSTVIGVLILEVLYLCSEDWGEEGLLGLFNEKLGRSHDFSLVGDNVIQTSSRFFFRIWELPIFVLMGCVGGLMGGIFVDVNVKITTLRHKYIPVTKPKRRLAEVVFMSFVTATIYFIINYSSPCVPVPPNMYGFHVAEHGSSGNATHGENATTVEHVPATEEHTEGHSTNVIITEEHTAPSTPHHDDKDGVEGLSKHRRLHEKAEEGKAYLKFHGDILSEIPVTSLYPQMNCPELEYNKFGQIFFTDTATALRRMIGLGRLPGSGESDGLDPSNLPLDVVATFYVVVFIMLTWTYGIGCASGLFVPSLALGGSFGLISAHMVQYFIGEPYGVIIAFPTYAVLGTGAVLGGATRMTVSITLLIAETTGATQLIIPLMITIFFSKLVGDFFNESIYDVHIHIRGPPILEEASLVPHQKMITDKLQASDMMCTKIIALPTRPKVSEVIHVLKNYSHSSFAITTEADMEKVRNGEPFMLAGAIRQQTLARLLKHRLGVIHQDKQRQYDERLGMDADAEPSGSPMKRAESAPKLKVVENSLDTSLAPGMAVRTESGMSNLEILEKLEDFPFKIKQPEMERIIDSFSESEKDECILNLEPFMDRDPPIIGRTENLSRTYQRLRTMGYHHLYVMDSRPTVVGIVTRKDLLEDTTKLKLGEKANRLKLNLEDAVYALPELPYLPVKGQRKSMSFAPDASMNIEEEDDEPLSRPGDSGHIPLN